MTVQRVLLNAASEWVATTLGLSYPPERLADLERGLRSAAAAVTSRDFESWLRDLPNGVLTTEEVAVVATKLTVGETYFFREPQAFEALREHVLSELLANGGS